MPVFRLEQELLFPPVELAEPDGLLAVGGDLSPERLILAYRQGIFPWFSEADPILWWAPDPRLVLFPEEFHLSRRLERTIRQQRFAVTVNRAFDRVIRECRDVRLERNEETWIDQRMVAAYWRLHRMGMAHSVECWQQERLAGGIYGVALGKVFFGESMFSRARDASKVALAHLCQLARDRGVALIDCQVTSRHLISLGARELPGRIFYPLVRKLASADTSFGRLEGT